MKNTGIKENVIICKNHFFLRSRKCYFLTTPKWCRQNQISPHNFRYWKDKLFPKSLQKSSFTELNMRRPDAVSLQARGIYIRVGSDCDLHLRKQLFALFAEVSC